MCFVDVRFLTVVPSTGADEQLVLDIVKFLATVVNHCDAGTRDSSAVNDTFSWIAEMLLINSGALYHLLSKTDVPSDSSDGKPSCMQAGRCFHLAGCFVS